jgi:acetoacetyl-[acyl-carrier protein] synthase
MKKLPVIVGFGGINAAGRSSFHHAYRRMVHEVLPEQDKAPMFEGLARLMNLENIADRDAIINGTLIREIEKQTFDKDNVSFHKMAAINSEGGSVSFDLKRRQLPDHLPANWKIESEQGDKVTVVVDGELDVYIDDPQKFLVSAGGQLPSGFDASKYYNAKHQPKGMQITVFGATDALRSMGIEWSEILKHIDPDEVSVYSGSAIGQMDELSGGGVCKSWLKGTRITSKQVPMMLPQMSADFVNSYIINSVGATGTNIGACASLLYNLRQGISDIMAGESRVIIVGGAEAPLVPEVMEGFRSMGALAEDSKLAALDNVETPDLRRACRPFSDNCGFTMGEGAQFFILMDDELAIELGATIYGSVPGVFVNADANKKSISSPGVGNYVTVAKAASLARAILGEEGVKHTFIQAHGTGTPQNRVTESHIMNEVAKANGISNWPVSGAKAYVGHTLGPAAGDQMLACLGVWEYGYIPGITTIDHLADDVYTSNIDICMEHKYVGEKGADIQAALVNAKGFGGNNATGVILSPQKTMEILNKRYADKMTAYTEKNKVVKQRAQDYDQQVIDGNFEAIYHFGTAVMGEDDVAITTEGMKLSEFANPLRFDLENPYAE